MDNNMPVNPLMMNYLSYLQQKGQQGTQSGTAQESDSAYYERLLQNILGGGLTLGGVGLGAVGGGALGGGPGAMAGGTLGAIPGSAVMMNADSPNIQDVAAHQWMQHIRRNGR